MSEFQLPLRVYIEDTDAGGIVYYVNYLKFMERARTEFLRHLGFGKAAILDDGTLLVVHSLNANYRKSAKLDDELLVSARVIQLQRAALTFEQKVLRGDELLCAGEVKIACVNPETMRPVAIPDDMRRVIEAFISDNAA